MNRLLPFLILMTLFAGCLWAQHTEEETKAALRGLAENAEKGDAKAIFDLARLYETGFDSIEQDSKISMALYLKSANLGYGPAMNYVGFSYYNGKGLNHDLDSALFWIKRAAEMGDVTAAANLGFLLSEAPDITLNEAEAEKWRGIAAQAGVEGAQIKFAELKTNEWKELPADSALRKGMKYYLDRAPIMGVKLLDIAAEKGSVKALALLGDAYSKGLGVPYSHQKSIDYFYEAAQGGDPSAQFIIAELLEIFPDVMKDKESLESIDATYWYEKASQAGITDSETAYSLLLSLPEHPQLNGNH